MKYAHGFVVLCLLTDSLLALVDFCDESTLVLHGASKVNVKDMSKIELYLTTTKHNKKYRCPVIFSF